MTKIYQFQTQFFSYRKHWPYPPKHKEIPFLMNMQTTIVLDPFTELNGATAIRPGMKKLILTNMFEKTEIIL